MTSTHVERLLIPLRELIINKSPYINGILQLPPSSFSLFYRIPKHGRSAIHIDLAHASFDELEQLAEATETIAGESASKMDAECFAPALVPVQTSLKKTIRDYAFAGDEEIRIELQELNVYSKGAFSKPRVDSPREQGMFGSLIIVFPTPHEGGTLLLRNDSHTWSFDHGKDLAATQEPSIGYTVVLYDAEHEVSPVTSGHLIALTYKLYFEERKPVLGKDPADVASEHLRQLTPLPNERAFCESFEALLENPEFLADGGTLGFGLRHIYPIKDDIKHVYGLLKGSDAIVYRVAQALGFEPILYLLYEWQPPWMKSAEGSLIDRPVDITGSFFQDWGVDITRVVRRMGGIVVCEDPDSYKNERGAYDKPEKVEWITPRTTFTGHEKPYVSRMGNEPGLGIAYGNVCLVVRIGKAGERLQFPTSAQLKQVWESEGWRPSAFWHRH